MTDKCTATSQPLTTTSTVVMVWATAATPGEGDVPPVERVTDRGRGRTSGGAPALLVVTAFGAMTLLAVLTEGFLLWPLVFGCLIVLCLVARPVARLHSRRSADANTAARWCGAGSGWPVRDLAVRSPFERPAFWDEPPVPATQ